jgi:hypothetical protein
MATGQRNGTIIAGSILILIGLVALLGQLFQGYDFWRILWPFTVIGVGIIFFVGMLLGGKSTAGLAVPGSIITTVGLMLFLQNLTNHWESWSYAWTLIIMSVGFGIFLMGIVAGDPAQRKSGLRVLRTGAILFIIFGVFFEMIFNSFTGSQIIFPALLILIGGYLVMVRSGLIRSHSEEKLNSPDQTTQENK